MNEVFVKVKIIKYKYTFLLNNKNNAICRIIGKLKNGSVIKILAYDKLADKCLRILKKGEIYLIEGKINSNMEVIIEILE